MSRITVTYSDEGGGEALAYTHTKQFDSRPTLAELDEFFEMVTHTIDPDSFEDECGYCDCQDDMDIEFVLTVADMVEDILEDMIVDTVEEFMDSVVDGLDEIEIEDYYRIAEENGVRRNDMARISAFKIGFALGLEEAESIMVKKFGELCNELSDDCASCDGCCDTCEL
jgi:hypothetical protein